MIGRSERRRSSRGEHARLEDGHGRTETGRGKQAHRGKSGSIGRTAARLRAWAAHHAQVMFNALDRLKQAPLATLMTTAVLGIALALPTGLYVLLQNMQAVSAQWESAAQISLFLKLDVSDARAAQLADELRRAPEIAEVNYLSRRQALEDFKRLSGFGDVLTSLDDNPLPPVLVVVPSLRHSSPVAAELLVTQLRKRPEVDIAQLDMQWLQRLYAIMEIGRRGVMILGVLLGLSVLLIVGNTIRLAIENRREEIEVTKLIGGTDAFIRRPFLYSGVWYGLFGALTAWALVGLSLGLLDGSVQRLSALYERASGLQALDLRGTALLLVAGVGLGLLGSWVAVARHLSEIEPR